MQNKFFEIFGRLMVVIIVLGSIAAAAYYYGMNRNGAVKEEELVIKTGESAATTTSDSTKPTVSPVKKVQVSAGAVEHTKYTVSVPEDWQVTKDPTNSNDMDKMTLTKNGYTVVLYQANM